jgi:hypothetical protein
MEAAASALAEQLASGATWPPDSPRRFRNMLLDACGSDHRPLVELLLRVGRHGMVDALRALDTTASTAWPSHRTRLVSWACGELFISADIAAWAVDAWAVALRVMPASAVQALQQEYAERERHAAAERERIETRSAARIPAPLRPTQGASPGAGGVGVARRGAAASRAGGAPQGGVGAWRRGTPVAATPMPAPNMPRFFASFFLVAVAMGGMVWSMGSLTPAQTVVQPATRLPRVAAPGGLPPVEPNGATAAVRDTDSRGAGDSPIVANARESVVVPRQSPSPAAAADGVFGVNHDTNEPIRWWAVDPAAHGVGGTYRVDQRILSVSGSKLCTPVADALGSAVRRSEEEITHTPGTGQFNLTSRPGVRGVLQPDGAFQTTTYFGEHKGVRYAFVMRGAFTPQGFVARTVTTTDAVIRYRQRQQCVIAADLVGTRLPPRGDSASAPVTESASPSP